MMLACMVQVFLCSPVLVRVEGSIFARSGAAGAVVAHQIDAQKQ